LKDIQKVGKHKDYDLNYRILMTEIRIYEKKLWDNNQFCSCGADHIHDCECEPEKKMRFNKRRKRKVNEKFDSEGRNLMMGRLPQHDSREGKSGYPSNENGEPER